MSAAVRRTAAAGADAAERLRAVAQEIMAAGESSPRLARDPVNLPIIENWLEALGDANPLYTDPAFATASVHGDLVAPPAMVQVWTMFGQHGTRDAGDPTGAMVAALDEAGYTSVVATNCDQVYFRYLRHGERLAVRVMLTDLTGPKQTALGEGWFFTTRSTWYSVGAGEAPGDGDGDGDVAGHAVGEPVATMDFRILKFRPPSADTERAAQRNGDGTATGADRPAAAVLRPVVSPDTAFFWDGTSVGELRIQQCGDCGVLRHPPGPMCPHCGSAKPQYMVASGTGEVFSYVVHHHPPVPGKRLPIVIALVQLDEGVRMVGELVGVRPDAVAIGQRVQVEFATVDDKLTLPAWRPAVAAPVPPASGALPTELPELVVDVTPTFVVASALATHDFTRVHHDRDFAIASGNKDIFLNILTTTGLVQRFVAQWAGPQAILRAISIRLGVPCYSNDVLRFSGQVTAHEREPGRDHYEVRVVGRCGLGDHVTGVAKLDVPSVGP